MRMRSLPTLCGLAADSLLAACGTDPAKNTITPHATARPSTAAAAALGSHAEKWIDLQVGDCVADLPPADLSRVTITVVDCATAHLAETFLRAPMAVDTAVFTFANRDCTAAFAPYTGKSLDGSGFSITYLIDSNQDRTGADPTPSTLICLLQSATGQPLTGSARR
ncbi:hypothetical protein [Mycobacterium stomatepiae]|uniref:Putative lipoprotein LppN n=1 Tax=Mycobacterium stomatepiae TaxID=470076 RepID=A0A7I7Q1B9_9MYCO|nr:hypothetical protein [Mycobacterium stomatepiae]MCV7166221.1 hypothetical protein [Mycobacterium stomatepiae]BBY19882.1 putative lipoprotein LppN [Mycobacterium stomatepiae]